MNTTLLWCHHIQSSCSSKSTQSPLKNRSDSNPDGWTWHGHNPNRLGKASIFCRQEKFANEFKLAIGKGKRINLAELFYKHVEEAIGAHKVDGVLHFGQGDRLQMSPHLLLHACVYNNRWRCGNGRGSCLNVAITRNTQHYKTRWISNSTAMTPGLILFLVLEWFSAKTPPWHSCCARVPGDWRLQSGGERAVNKTKQKGCFSTHEVNSYGQAWSGATQVPC